MKNDPKSRYTQMPGRNWVNHIKLKLFNIVSQGFGPRRGVKFTIDIYFI